MEQIKFTREAEKQLDKIEPSHREYILNKIEKLKTQGFGPSTNTKIIEDPEHGQIWRQKAKKGNKGGLDYRIFLDYVNQKLIVLTIKHRDQAYEK